DAGGVRGPRQHESFSIDEQVAFAALDLLPPVVAAHAADAGGLDRLTVNNARAGLGIAPEPHPQPLAQHHVEPLPGAVEAPLAEVMVDRLAGGGGVGQQGPGSALAYDAD